MLQSINRLSLRYRYARRGGRSFVGRTRAGAALNAQPGQIGVCPGHFHAYSIHCQRGHKRYRHGK